VRNSSVWRRLVGVGRSKIKNVNLEADVVVLRVELSRPAGPRCGVCGKPCGRYDGGRGRRRWRSLDLGATRTFIEAEVGRVSCIEHGVVVERVPWADHDSRFTRAFEDQAAWLAVECSKTAVAALMRMAWRTVGSILTRVARRVLKPRRRLAGLRRIGIDEISFRRGQRYIIVVVDHDSGRLVWAAEGRDEKTLNLFFEALGRRRSQRITHVSADGATWISNAVRRHCRNAVLGMDPFHVVAWATKALDQIRRDVWNDARSQGHAAHAVSLKRSRWALLKNAQDLSSRQQAKLAWVEKVNQPLFRAHLLKEQLRLIFQLPFDEALDLLEQWLDWALQSRLEPFVELAYTITNHLDQILVTLDNRLTNALVEAVNTRIRLITRRAFGFHSSEPLIALAMLSLGAYRPTLPGRAA